MEEKKPIHTQFKGKDEEIAEPINRAKMLRKESEHFRKKTSKKRIFDNFARLWRLEHISLVRTPIDAIQDVPESQQTGLKLCSFKFSLKMDPCDIARDIDKMSHVIVAPKKSSEIFETVRPCLSTMPKCHSRHFV